jgi:very-short-patch-repair endonuclease
VRRAGLPEPDANTSLDAPDHPGLEVDFYWPAQRLVVETDGWDTHKTRAAFKSDRRKDAALTSVGFHVMRFTYDDVVHDADTVVARLRRRSAPA